MQPTTFELVINLQTAYRSGALSNRRPDRIARRAATRWPAPILMSAHKRTTNITAAAGRRHVYGDHRGDDMQPRFGSGDMMLASAATPLVELPRARTGRRCRHWSSAARRWRRRPLRDIANEPLGIRDRPPAKLSGGSEDRRGRR
jgi:hypothetical protein